MNKSQLFPSKYIKVDDLQGKDVPLTIAKLTLEDIDGERGKETKPLLSFQGVAKGLILNVTNFDSISMQHGEETDNWTGKSITLYPDQTRFGGKVVDCVRVRTQAPVAQAAVAMATPVAAPAEELDDPIPFG